MAKKEQKKASYLERLVFDPKLLVGPIAAYLTNIRLVILLVIAIVLLGVTSFLSLPNRLNPEVKIPIITVITVLPGAGPQDIETLITEPLEDSLRGLKDVDSITSVSRENVSAITVQFLSKVDRDAAKDDVQSQVDTVNELPDDATAPTVTALDFEDQPVLTFSLTTTNQYPDLMRGAKELQNSLEDITTVDRVITSGYDEQEISIEISQSKLSSYGLNPFGLSQLIKKNRASYPAGNITTDSNTIALSIDASVETIEDIRNLTFASNGSIFSLSDVASISEKSKVTHTDSYIGTPEQQSKPTVVFSVYKTTDADIGDAGKLVTQRVLEFEKEYEGKYSVTVLSNTSEAISKQFTDLLGEFRSTIILIFFTLLLFLGLRQAVISSFTVPLTFLSAFILMQVTGMSINFLSLFALLLSLGLLIDDTIVIVSAMTSYYRSNRFTPVQTGLLVWKDTIVPIWSTTITTIWSFAPLLLASGIIGEFIKPIPVVITITMLSSTAIAVLITLPVMIVLLKPTFPKRVMSLFYLVAGIAVIVGFGYLVNASHLISLLFILLLTAGYILFGNRKRVVSYLVVFSKKIQARYPRFLSKKNVQTAAKIKSKVLYSLVHGTISLEPFAAWYKRAILSILQSKSKRIQVLVGVFVYAIVCFSLLPLGFIKNEFFPKEDVNELYVQLELPSGSNTQSVTAIGLQFLEELRATEQTLFTTMEIGKSAGGFGGGGGNNSILYSIRLTDAEDRSVTSTQVAEGLREQFLTYTQGIVSVVEQAGGPPAGADIQITLLGEDLDTLDVYANSLVSYLKDSGAVTNVEKSIKPGISKVVFVPDLRKFAENGVTPDMVGVTLRTFASGFTLDSFQILDSDEEVKDVVLKTQSDVALAKDLTSLQMTTPTGKTLPLSSLGYFESKINPTSITRDSYKRSIAVTGAIKTGYTIPEENKKLESFVESLQLKSGYEWKTGGANEENNESVQSILRAMLVSAVLILITMVVQFKSFRQAVIVLIVIPLAVSSVFLIFALTGTPLSFPALIGVLSLFGIVVTNSMFIVDKINLNQKEGMELVEAIADAGASRMEPIILTKLSTVLGLLPITLSDPLWRGLGGSIISGLLLASTIMLLFIPVLYYSWMKTGNEISKHAK